MSREIGVAANAQLRQRYSTIWSEFVSAVGVGRRAPESAWPASEESADQTQLSCLISVQESRDILDGLQHAQTLLGAQPALVPHEPRFWHITVRMFGVALGDCLQDGCDVRDYAGRLTASPAIRAVLRSCVPPVSAFPIELRGLNAWLGATIVQVFDGGGIAGLRQCIQEALPELTDRNYPGGFIPHLTLGLHRPAADLAELVPALSRLRDLPIGRCLARSVELVWGRAASPHPELVTLGAFRLK